MPTSRFRTNCFNYNGFTLVELMIVIIIIAILTTISISYFQDMLLKSDLTNSQENIVIYMQRARSMAMKQDAIAGLWFQTKGFTAFIDTNKNGVYDAGTDAMIGPFQFRGKVLLASGCGNRAVEAGTREYVLANGDGFIGTKSSGIFTPQDWQIFIYNPGLAVGDQAREVEALSNGLVQKVMPGSPGIVAQFKRQANYNGAICGTPP